MIFKDQSELLKLKNILKFPCMIGLIKLNQNLFEKNFIKIYIRLSKRSFNF